MSAVALGPNGGARNSRMAAVTAPTVRRRWWLHRVANVSHRAAARGVGEADDTVGSTSTSEQGAQDFSRQLPFEH
jgi:hypothetical protein